MVIATAATTAAISSATDDEGLINQGFKLVVILGLALAVGTGIFLIYSLTSIWSDITATGGGLLAVFKNVIGFTPVGTAFTGLTYLFSAFGFGGRK